MGGFLGGLGELLGGFNAQRRIDTEGFDWREKAAQEEAARQRTQQEWQQADEDRAINQATDYLTSAEQPDMESAGELFGPQVDQKRKTLLLGAAAGKAKQSKSALRAQDSYYKRLEQGDKDQAALAREEFKAQKRAELKQLEEEIRSNQGMSPREKDLALMRIQAQREMFEEGQNRSDARARMGSVRVLFDSSSGKAAGAYNSRPGPDGGVQMVDIPDEMRGLRATPPPASVQSDINRGAAALGAISSVKRLYSRAREKGEDWVGPGPALGYDVKSGWGGYVLGPPSAERALFSSQVAGLQNEGINLRTGAQMSEHEVPRLMRELPTLADHGPVFEAKLAVSEYRFGLMDKVRRGEMSKEEAIRYMESVGPENFLGQFGGKTGPKPPRPPQPPGPRPPAGLPGLGGGPMPPGGEEKYKPGDVVNTPSSGPMRFKGGDYRVKSNWEPAR